MISASPQAANRAWVNNVLESAYTPDIAGEIDTEEEILAEELECSVVVARRVIIKLRQERDNHAGNSRELFVRVISKLLEHPSRASIYGLACAGGLDEVNGFHSQAEIARMLNMERASISHWVTAWSDYLSEGSDKFTITKFRKRDESRQTFQKRATDPFTALKRAAYNKSRTK
jgi:hypothetical protein